MVTRFLVSGLDDSSGQGEAVPVRDGERSTLPGVGADMPVSGVKLGVGTPPGYAVEGVGDVGGGDFVDLSFSRHA